MARPQKLYSEQEKTDIESAYKKSKNLKEQKRLLCLKLRIVEGYSSNNIASIVGYNAEYIDHIISCYNRFGLKELAPKKQGGNRRNLTVEQEIEFLKSFSNNAEDGKILEVSDIIRAYEKLVGKSVSKCVVYNLLKRHNWRKVMPRAEHPKKASVEEIEAYKKNHRKNKQYGKI